jgi:hypothetical protein
VGRISKGHMSVDSGDVDVGVVFDNELSSVVSSSRLFSAF